MTSWPRTTAWSPALRRAPCRPATSWASLPRAGATRSASCTWFRVRDGQARGALAPDRRPRAHAPARRWRGDADVITEPARGARCSPSTVGDGRDVQAQVMREPGTDRSPQRWIHDGTEESRPHAPQRDRADLAREDHAIAGLPRLTRRDRDITGIARRRPRRGGGREPADASAALHRRARRGQGQPRRGRGGRRLRAGVRAVRDRPAPAGRQRRVVRARPRGRRHAPRSRPPSGSPACWR